MKANQVKIATISFILLSTILFAGISRGLDTKSTFVITLKEGQIANISGKELRIEIIKVRSSEELAQEGCLGGPLGCSGSVVVKVSRGKESREIVLLEPRNPTERELRAGQAEVFGNRIILQVLHENEVDLKIEDNNPVK